MDYPRKIFHWINNEDAPGRSKNFFIKCNPLSGEALSEVTRGSREDVNIALEAAIRAYERWDATPVIKRAEILRSAALLMQAKKDELAEMVACECGKSKKAALGEVDAAVEHGLFMAGEGRRYYGKVLTSAMITRSIQLIRQSIGIGALIVPFNNPLVSVAGKSFPALLCGNAVILKSHEDTPCTAIWFAKLLKEAGLPDGVFSVLQGFGNEIGSALINDERISFISFTGSVDTARVVLSASVNRLLKVSVESGGKNPFIVCEDADLKRAADLAVASSFIDAGQRCAAASRIIILESVYEKFKDIFLSKIRDLKVGASDTDDYGAIINEKKMNYILSMLKDVKTRGATVLTGGERLIDRRYRNGYFIAPTVLENISPEDTISKTELFGPVTILYKAKDFQDALDLANNSPFKLSGAIQTRDMSRAEEFIKKYKAGVVRVNGPTHGSEPHIPFGGLGLSGNGWREAGELALDFYSEWKQVSIDYYNGN